MKQEKSIKKLAFSDLKSKYTNLLLPLSIFAVIFILSLMLAFVSPITLILTVPFLIIPGFFSLTAITVSPANTTKTGSLYFLLYRNYFSPFFKSGYRVIIGFLKALLVYAIISSIASTVFEYTILIHDPAYTDLINQMENLESIDSIIPTILNLVETNGSFKLFMFLTTTIAFFGGFYMFVHHLSINSMKMYLNLSSPTPMPSSDLNLINKMTMKKIRKGFYKEYVKALWFFPIILLIGYAGGVVLGYFLIPNLDALQCSLLGVFFDFILVLFLLPYFFNVLRFIFERYRTNYIDTFIDLSMKSIEELKKTTTISEEKEKQIKEFLDKTKEANDKIKEEENK